MLQQFLEKSAQWFLQQGYISAEDRDVFAYCLEVCFCGLLTWGIIAWIAFYVDLVCVTLVYFGVFLLFRSVCGGYHATTHLRCYLLTVGSYLVCLVICTVTPVTSMLLLSMVLCGLADVLLWQYAPVDTPNKPFTQEEHIIFRKRTIRYLLLFNLVMIVLWLYGIAPSLLYCSSLGVFQLAISVVVGHRMNSSSKGACR